MPRLISDVLGAAEPHFSHTIMEWERRSGHPSHDVRLLNDISHRRQSAIKELGLDNKDTTARELYFMLKDRALNDSERFLTELNISPSDSAAKMVEAIVRYIHALPYPRDLWVVKQSCIKSSLKVNPPKKLMKLLGLRSIDSVIKRANVSEFLSMAYEVENETWLMKLHSSYKKFRTSDLQTSKSELIILSSKNREKLVRAGEQQLAIVRPNFETGTLLISPPEKRFRGDALGITLAIIDALSELRAHSAYFRHVSVHNDFGIRFSQSLTFGLPSLPASAHTINWRDLQHYLTTDQELLEEIMQPHFQKEDLSAPSAIEALGDAWPALDFWRPLQGVFHNDTTGLVSCHLIDILAGAVNELEPERLPRDYMQARLWQELGAKYLSEKALRTELLENIV